MTNVPPSGAGLSAERDDEPTIYDVLSQAFPATPEGRLLFAVAVAFSTFQLASAAHLIDLPSQIVRAVHVGFLLLLAFPFVAMASRWSWPMKVMAWGLGIASFAVAVYQWIEYEPLLLRAGDPTHLDIVIGVVSLALLFAGTWLVMGSALPILSGLFLLYCLIGNYLPYPIDHRGYDFAQVIEHMAYGTEGIYGVPTFVSSSYIFLFILFGAFLERAGMIRLFTDISLGMFGRSRGGPAKVAVFSSALMGTISGSGVANVVTTGQFTIPLMKRFGYSPAFAGGVEATASMGGQIMPPVMGAVAFIMAETIDVPYVEIAKAAVIPALLYFFAAYWMVHIEAGKRGLMGLSAAEVPSAWVALRDGWYLILPLAVLVYFLFSGYTPMFAGSVGLLLTKLLIMGAATALGLPEGIVRIAFWIGLGLAAGACLQYDIWAIGLMLAVLAAVLVLRAPGRATLADMVVGLAEGARTALSVGIACAVVGIMIGTMTLTGVATTFGSFVVSVGEESLFLSLILTMVMCLILGMGIPTIPNYIITASLAGPALLELGVPLIVSHMFVFYFGILADLTPPVALACFAAEPIARESGYKISIEACKIAAAGFVIPFMAVYTPALMLQDAGPLAQVIGYPGEVAYIVGKTVLAIILWGAAVVGFLMGPMSALERVLATVSAFTLVAAVPWTDEVGFAVAAIVIGWHWWRTRLSTAAPAGPTQAASRPPDGS
ncbi:MAG: TRAP transporter permease [Hyphomicrobiaceae bacterium]|nr:TRAP transporter permease [Hyphomicrobiaceae bacterium]